MIEWLLLPININKVHEVDFFISWHARLMVIAWCFCVPIAIIITRYFKVLPNQNWPKQLDNKFWWYSHLSLQVTAMMLSIIGLILIIINKGGGEDLHRTLGWMMLSMMIAQGLSGLLRGSKGGPTEPQLRGDHYDMTKHRYLFEYLHKTFGYLTVLIANINIILGLLQVNAPRWMLLFIVLWWFMILIAVIVCQQRKLYIKTYQAVWGNSKQHPGNQTPYR